MSEKPTLSVTSVLHPTMQKFSFSATLQNNKIVLERDQIRILQINVGKVCNQACLHCHVEAGPKRTESMNQKTASRIVELMKNSLEVQILDITGGAPEINPYFRTLVSEAKKVGKHVMDRCNLTILLEPGFAGLAEFLADHEVEIIASLPCYLEENVDQQRGKGVFHRSISALQKLNELGYGKKETPLKINLVYNPVGQHLPPNQESLENDYKQELKRRFDIEFNHLFTLTNMPIKRYFHQLVRQNKLEEYMELLVNAFNPSIVDGLMCRNQLSISWEGNVYDCDFNQMLELSVHGSQKTIWDFDTLQEFSEKKIAVASHCFGCTAGSGSSCGGALS